MEDKKNVKAVNSKSIGSIRAYFIRGHGGWLLYGVWFLSNIAILYVLLGSQMDWIYQLFSNIFIFGSIFVISYIVIAVIIGYVDIEVRGIYGQESDVYWKAIPSVQKLLAGVEDIAELKESVEEIKTILRQLIMTIDKELLLEDDKIGH